jgi:ABC-2 type transport system ATP-binding protein
MMELVNLSKSFGKKKVLHSVNLRLDAKVHGLLGANGAGKTTLLRCMTGLFEPSQGNILFNHEQLHKSKSFRNSLGYLPQTFGMFRELTLFEMMDYFCTLKNIPKAQCAGEINKALSLVNLEDRITDRIKTLSGGMIRRAGIAQAVLGNPQILLLDEPTAGLDPGERARFKNMISMLKEERLIMISTHIVEDVDACCSNVVVIDGGNILFQGSCDALRNIAKNKVYTISQVDYDRIVGDSFLLKISEIDGMKQYRILTRERQDFPDTAPSLEDGYMCLVKELV